MSKQNVVWRGPNVWDIEDTRFFSQGIWCTFSEDRFLTPTGELSRQADSLDQQEYWQQKHERKMHNSDLAVWYMVVQRW